MEEHKIRIEPKADGFIVNIRHNTNFRCEIDLNKELARVYYPILKVTWKESEELERQKLELRG